MEILFSEDPLLENLERDLWALERINDFTYLNYSLVDTLELVILYHENGKARKRAIEIYAEHLGKPGVKFSRKNFRIDWDFELKRQRKGVVKFLREVQRRELAKFRKKDPIIMPEVIERDSVACL